jgi:hypothetical protein
MGEEKLMASEELTLREVYLTEAIEIANEFETKRLRLVLACLLDAYLSGVSHGVKDVLAQEAEALVPDRLARKAQ